VALAGGVEGMEQAVGRPSNSSGFTPKRSQSERLNVGVAFTQRPSRWSSVKPWNAKTSVSIWARRRSVVR
jgi:hypothetical protein